MLFLKPVGVRFKKNERSGFKIVAISIRTSPLKLALFYCFIIMLIIEVVLVVVVLTTSSSFASSAEDVVVTSDESNSTFLQDHEISQVLLDEEEEVVISSELSSTERTKQRAIRSLMKIFGVSEVLDHNNSSSSGTSYGPAPEFMVELYNTITDSYGVTRARNPYGAHVIRSFMERDTGKYDVFMFNLNSSTSNNSGSSSSKLRDTESVVEAELHLYRNPTSHDRLHPSLYLTPFYILSLYQVVEGRTTGVPDLHKLLGVHYVAAMGAGWEVFNVTQTVKEWLRGDTPNLGFIVAATSLGGDRVPVTFSRRSTNNNDHDHHAPNTRSPEGSDSKNEKMMMMMKSDKQPILVLFNHDSDIEMLNNRRIITNNINNTPPGFRKTNSFHSDDRGGGGDQDRNDEDNSATLLPSIPNSSLENPRFHHSLLYKETIRHPNSVGRYRSRRSKNQTEDVTNSTTNSTNTSTTTTPPSSCGKHDLFISFEAIGWSSWIISPKGYNAYYCTGPCVFPLSHEVTPTNHATLQSIAHELALAPEVGRPCCVPTKLLPISLLYYDDDDNVVLKQYVDMVADTCGCH